MHTINFELFVTRTTLKNCC